MSIAKNYIYNVIYQIITLIIPLITVPYISRVLGSNGIGITAYTNSIIQYFILFGTIGIAFYGNRSIAYVRDNKEKLYRTFWSIFFLKLLTTFISYILFVVFLLLVNSYETIFLIQSVYIISAALDITWLYMGLEDFKKTVIRNLFVKILGVISIFVFVRTGVDLWKYVFILAFSELIGQLTMWFYLPKTVRFVRLKLEDIKTHILPALSMFLPQIAIQIYAVLNKTMLGYLSNTDEVGFFDNADKIIKMALAVVTAMGVVMLPRVSNTYARGETNKVKDYLYKSLDFASYLSFPMMFGLAGIAVEFCPWFFGPGFSKTATLIWMISPIVVLIAWSNVLGIQYLMPTGKVKAFTISVSVGAIVNFIINLVLIRYYQSLGTAIATLVAEAVVTLGQMCFIWKDIQIKRIYQSIWKYFVSGMIMFGIIRFIGMSMKTEIKTTVIQLITGIIMYFSLLFILRSELNKKIFVTGLQLIKKKRKANQ